MIRSSSFLGPSVSSRVFADSPRASTILPGFPSAPPTSFPRFSPLAQHRMNFGSDGGAIQPGTGGQPAPAKIINNRNLSSLSDARCFLWLSGAGADGTTVMRVTTSFFCFPVCSRAAKASVIATLPSTLLPSSQTPDVPSRTPLS